MPPPERDYAQWKVSARLKEDIQHANHVFYGRKGASWKLEKHRVCWYVILALATLHTQILNWNLIANRDAFTTSSDFIISPHSASKGLYVATCGNFHGWKFFPVLGKYVVQMLEGSLDAQMADKWSWDRDRPDPSLNPDWPRAEMKDLLDPVRASRL